MKAEYPEIEPPLGRLFTLLGKGYLNILQKKLSQLDINRNFHALLIIESRKGKITQQELAELLNTDKVCIVRVIDYLTEKGYVKRSKQSIDKRKHSLLLTTKAIQAIPGIKKAISETNEIALFWFDTEQIQAIYTLLEKVKNNINAYNIPK